MERAGRGRSRWGRFSPVATQVRRSWRCARSSASSSGAPPRLARTERPRELAEEAALRLEACDRLGAAPGLEPDISAARPHFARRLARLEALRTPGGTEVARAHDEVIRLTRASYAGGAVVVRGRRSGDRAALEVIDHGIGIAGDALPDLFAPFRGRAPEIAPGAGLGLSVVRRIVVAHGGTIEVHSAPHAGSTFRVSLPLATAAASPAEEAPPGAALRGSPA